MDWNEMKEHWAQARQAVKERWEKLTDQDVEDIRGDRTLFIGRIQERYGLAEDEARKQADEFVASYRRARISM